MGRLRLRQANVIASGNELIYQNFIHGMWNMDRYIQLLMGEIPRLADQPDGYGPQGKDFIAHVDIPQEVQEAFHLLTTHFGTEVRQVNPKYASINNDMRRQ